MSESPEEVGPRCRVALDVALAVASDICGSREELFKMAAEMLGLDASSMNPISMHCMEVLKRGLDTSTCVDFVGIRRWVMCRAWEKLQDKTFTVGQFAQAVKESWAEAKEKCATLASRTS